MRLELDKKSGYVFRATKSSDDKKLRTIKGEQIEVLNILKNGVLFVTRNLKNAAARYQEMKTEYNQKQVRAQTRYRRVAKSGLEVVRYFRERVTPAHLTPPRLAVGMRGLKVTACPIFLPPGFQGDLVRRATETACSYLPLIEAAGRMVAELDVLVSLGTVAALAPSGYVRPKLLPAGSGVLKVKGGRHPCLERQEETEYIPNDYELQVS